MRAVTLLCTLEHNKKGSWELEPIVNFPKFKDFSFTEEFFDVEAELGKYYKVRSGALQSLMLTFRPNADEYSNVVVALFQERKNLVLKRIYPVKFGKEFKMSASSKYLVNVKSVSNPTPVAIRKELEAVAVKGLFPLVNITYASVSQKRIAVNIPVSIDEDVAIKVADILASNGALAEVTNQENGSVVYSPAAKAVAAKKPEAAKAVVAAAGGAPLNPDYFYVPQILKDISQVVAALSQSPMFSHESIIISGPSGWGKTAFCKPLAEKLGMSLEYVDMSMVLETEELFGQREIKGGDTIFAFNHFVEAVERGNTIVVADEVNRTYAGALNAFLPLLDWRGETIIRGRRIKVGPRTLFIATRNIGNSYVGTQASDAALVSRFGFAAIVDSMPAPEEIRLLMERTGVSKAEAGVIVKVANAVREQRDMGVNVSPRNTLAIAAMVKVGIQVRAAYQWNVLLKEEEQETRVQLESIFNRLLSQDYGVAMDMSNLPSIF